MEYLRPLQRTGDASLLAYGDAERDGHIAFATAYLAGAPNVHSGGFAAPIRETRSWRAFLDIMLAHSPALCACLGATCSLHVVIDSADDAEPANLSRGVVVHRFAPDGAAHEGGAGAANDARHPRPHRAHRRAARARARAMHRPRIQAPRRTMNS